ncbi:Planctomycete cytochrome C [Planctomycetes bacterium Pan216]|uniref:Planctomycete cytochrome C n=1 Tax=Kolteria novifilia TaxID=2527975 RepID=A0A518B1C0_9BACT|nr:Planctomycete cytochrome C [Planctomycetes bacterium Pan216]
MDSTRFRIPLSLTAARIPLSLTAACIPLSLTAATIVLAIAHAASLGAEPPKRAASSSKAPKPQDAAGLEYFENHIRPLLANRCFDCHSEDYTEGGLRLDSFDHVLKGGDSGEPALVAGKPDASLLVEAIRYKNDDFQMPPDERLPAKEIAALERWIEMGAPWPGADQAARTASHITEDDRAFWSFQPLERPPVPKTGSDWPRNDIDHFVLERMRERGLSPADESSRLALLRRLFFNLTGLPPTPREVASYMRDDSPEATAKLIDRLLGSPHYGERWGRHWLDVARYADTQGDVADYPIPWAWKYRNWVYRAIAEDLPIDDFLRWQIAGDLLAHGESDPDRFRDQHIATGFIALSRRFGQFTEGNDHLVIEDTIDAFGRGMLGLTLRCARCHNHKFDPIPATDYYGLYGMFESTRYPTAGNATDRMPQRLVAVSHNEHDQSRIDDYWARVQRMHRVAGRAGSPAAKKLFEEYQRLKSSGDEESLEQFLKRNELLREAFEHGLRWPREEWARLLRNPPETEMVFGVVDQPNPDDARLHRFGNPERLGSTVPRGVLEIVAGSNPVPGEGESGRRELADWLTDPANTLTARVFVNRVWQWHFGEGLVRTPDNFGKLGEAPTHPELLDWLAWKFVHEDDWSLKKLHRRILLSRTYQQSSLVSERAEQVDPDNRLLSHFSRRRLDAESIRDAMLHASGELVLDPAREHPFTHLNGGFYRQYTLNYPFDKFYPNFHRSCYQLVARLNKHPILGLFDGPDRNQSTSKRTTSNTSTQALYFMNAPWVQKRAEAFAKRLLAEYPSPRERVRAAVRDAWGRDPNEAELERFQAFLRDYRLRLEAAGERGASLEAMTGFCRVLLSGNEFLFID